MMIPLFLKPSVPVRTSVSFACYESHPNDLSKNECHDILEVPSRQKTVAINQHVEKLCDQTIPD